MKFLKAIAIIISLIIAEPVWAQEARVTGFLLFSPWRTDNSFDLFFPAKIDSTKDIRYNLRNAKFNTAVQMSAGNLFWNLLKSTIAPDTIRNESVDTSDADYLKYYIVFPVVAMFNKKTTELFYKNFSNELRSWPVSFYGKKLFIHYNSRPRIYDNTRIIQLPKRGN